MLECILCEFQQQHGKTNPNRSQTRIAEAGNPTHRCLPLYQVAFSTSLCKELDGLQNKMVAVMTREVGYPDEQLANYIKRRNQMASRVAGRRGRWSHIWAKRVVALHDCMHRQRNAESLVSRIFHWHVAAWLREQRLEHGSTAGAGRTRTRIPISMPVQQRWEEGVAEAEILCPEAADSHRDHG